MGGWQPESIILKAPLESNGAIPVNIQDQTSRALDLFFIQSQNQTTLTDQADPNATSIKLTDTTGFTAGRKIGVFSGSGNFYFGNQLGAPVAGEISLDTPIDITYAAGSTVIASEYNMNVDGSGAMQIFQIGPIGVGAGISIDVTRLLVYIQDNSAMDDALFGALPALTKGIVLRKNNGTMQNYWNIKSNGEFALLCFDATYTSSAPAGSFGFRARNTYAGQDKHGVTIRLSPGDILELLIQDNLTGLEVFNMMAQGHVVTD